VFYAWLAPEKVLLDYAKTKLLRRLQCRRLSPNVTMYEVLHVMICVDGVADIDVIFLRLYTYPLG